MEPGLSQVNVETKGQTQQQQQQPQSSYNFQSQVIKVAAVASGFPLSASSEDDPSHSVHRAMINYNKVREGASTWCAAENDTNQWVQVCLIQPKLVTGVALQGRQNATQWVTRFKVMYSLDGSTWTNHENGQEFEGSMDQNTVVEVKFKESFVARSVRIVPIQWHEHISMSFEVYFME
ncbi:galactose-binding domain-containing protein [Stylonychia lemnae]|uniref:Galactose-binding domain-containing protein n=1 Tax=Stylonychia lemnae TaxID=5949 RepID=A0A078BAJ4_STYLE|nr:galactose-binding domain-containing protein [Stylonychia lemnae]|eukprot:CDW91374.1 galactose-binding domain-containing protein [Stylonychia lemnae]